MERCLRLFRPLDLHLPGLLVARLVEQLKATCPGNRFIGLSGGGMHQDPESALRADGAPQGPVSNDSLLAEVRALLER